MENQTFVEVTEIKEVLWQISDNRTDANFSFCGLGYEAASSESVGWLGRAHNAGLISNQTYSYVLAPYHDEELV